MADEKRMVFRVVVIRDDGSEFPWQDWPRKDDEPRAERQAAALQTLLPRNKFRVDHVEVGSKTGVG